MAAMTVGVAMIPGAPPTHNSDVCDWLCFVWSRPPADWHSQQLATGPSSMKWGESVEETCLCPWQGSHSPFIPTGLPLGPRSCQKPPGRAGIPLEPLSQEAWGPREPPHPGAFGFLLCAR